MDNSLLDVSVDIIGETPKKKPMPPKSFAKAVVERLAIVTPSGRVNAAESLSSNIGDYYKVLSYNTIVRVYQNSNCLYRSTVPLLSSSSSFVFNLLSVPI